MSGATEQEMAETWPPSFTLDRERILNLLTGDRFYSDASAALREAVLNAIDAIRRREFQDAELRPRITVAFDQEALTLTVSDNGDGMNRTAVSGLFARIGATAANLEGNTGSVGEFGIGVISYFMAGDSFTLQTWDGEQDPIGLKFGRQMLAGGGAELLGAATRTERGTTVEINVLSPEVLDLLIKSFPHWCRDVDGLSATLRPGNRVIGQGGAQRPDAVIDLPKPEWIERSHLAPVSSPGGWDSMSGASTVSVLYRGVFVQEFSVKRLWGIEGSIDVDPKHFKPKLNREGFVEGVFGSEVEEYLKQVHPKILEEMARRLSAALERGALDKWTEKRWATLWLSIPRQGQYASATKTWDAIFRRLPAFELAAGNRWEPLSLERLLTLSSPVYVAPLAEQKTTDIINAALRLLRHTKKSVIRGVRPDRGWLGNVPLSFGTTPELISAVFANELPELIQLNVAAESVLSTVTPVVTLYSGSPSIDLVKLGNESPPVLRLKSQLILNVDNPIGKAMVSEALVQNTGPWALIGITARHSHEHISQVVAAVRDLPTANDPVGLVKRRFIRGLLT